MRSARAVRGTWAGTAAAVLASLVVASATPAHADTIRSRQWHLDVMHAEEMWETSTGAGVTVAVIDSGVDASLPDLRGQVLEGKNFSGEPGDAHTDSRGHGTGVSALIAGTGKRGGDTGAYGLAPGVKILPLRVGGKDFEADSKSSADAIRYAAESDARIINISRGSPGRSTLEEEAISYALSKGKLIFASVGNTGDKSNVVGYPAAYPGVIGVAAFDQEGNSATWSQRGSQVDLAAPGVEIIGACAGRTGVCRTNGTSDAAALASASAALIWSVHPTWTANQVTRVLVNTAGGTTTSAKRDDYVGYGAVRPRIALKDPGDPGPADVNPLPGPDASTPSKPEDSKTKADGLPKDKQPEAAAESDDGTPASWIAIGAGAALVIAAAVTVPIVLARRRKAAGGS
ncbi:type VII secretion-associated serine protease mycosin [Streptomyces albireticuli]|uniref:Type VII secretion-associated serine protease mycosin n=1 Tax=Streptomyces albireticuli TaxID=1940 RepID=A0A2A2D5L5_9ACTN|nr:type VII secretion-associated serine protease mycosin [Streptomyces albireticuli]MCD9141493.1 type VII secretion-associated serine protease mycosin [Streptomyces albireticuli]MCD9164256.1 type VII secretion-associated serine protease mycosin [Streptomyces albireticuli]MCD9189667.1 type VII secretion-associated serine protease mycosin [Streptomyces albireticuli]PAU46814.1 type VII secretion-associated serine protease mycosin [Streptomyces albireticuli]